MTVTLKCLTKEQQEVSLFPDSDDLLANLDEYIKELAYDCELVPFHITSLVRDVVAEIFVTFKLNEDSRAFKALTRVLFSRDKAIRTIAMIVESHCGHDVELFTVVEDDGSLGFEIGEIYDEIDEANIATIEV